MTDLVERLRALQATLAQMTDSEFAVACSGEFCEDFKNTIEGCIANSLDRIEQLEAGIARKDEALRACNGATAMIEWIEWREGDKRPVAAEGDVILWHFPAQPPARYHNVGLPSYTTQDFAPARAVEGTKYARIALP